MPASSSHLHCWILHCSLPLLLTAPSNTDQHVDNVKVVHVIWCRGEQLMPHFCTQVLGAPCHELLCCMLCCVQLSAHGMDASVPPGDAQVLATVTVLPAVPAVVCCAALCAGQRPWHGCHHPPSGCPSGGNETRHASWRHLGTQRCRRPGTFPYGARRTRLPRHSDGTHAAGEATKTKQQGRGRCR